MDKGHVIIKRESVSASLDSEVLHVTQSNHARKTVQVMESARMVNVSAQKHGLAQLVKKQLPRTANNNQMQDILLVALWASLS